MSQTKSRAGLSPELLVRFREIVGSAHTLTDPDQQLPYLREWRDLYQGRTSVVLRPGTTAEVSRILALAHQHSLPVAPQAGNTGLVGGQIPMHGEMLLSLGRLKRLRAIDPAGYTMTVEAGMTLAEAQAAANKADRLFPLSLASEGSCQIGGNLATNAGGVAVLAYGSVREQTLGLEVVLADGRVWDGLKCLRKDNTGYALKDLFIGSEGTLGVITAAVLKLVPKPAEKATAFVTLPDLSAALALFRLAQETAGTSLTAFEFMPWLALEFVVRNVPDTRDPFSVPHPWYALLETSALNADGAAERLLTAALEAAAERKLIGDATLARSLGQARDLWRLRESVSEAQKPEGGSIKHDISVPVASIPAFVARANAVVEKLCPGARPLAMGHLGDGNVHYNIAQPVGMDKEKFLARWPEIARAVHDTVVAMGGSISAEHGIGQLKRAELARVNSAVEMDLMRRIKAALDPKGILNPGKVL